MADYKSFVGAMAILFAIAAAPQWVSAAPVAGDNEIEAAGGAFHNQGTSSGNFNLDLHYGYYLTPGWEVGLRHGLNYNFIHHGRDSWTNTDTPFLIYNFNFNDKFIPYLGGDIGIVWNDRDITGTLGPNAGLKIFLADQTFLNLGYRYEWFFHRIEDVPNHTNNGNHVANIGIGFVWGGARTTAKP
jgi:opacity protein-like surface antigen